MLVIILIIMPYIPAIILCMTGLAWLALAKNDDDTHNPHQCRVCQEEVAK